MSPRTLGRLLLCVCSLIHVNCQIDIDNRFKMLLDDWKKAPSRLLARTHDSIKERNTHLPEWNVKPNDRLRRVVKEVLTNKAVLEYPDSQDICAQFEKLLYRDQALISGPIHDVPDSALSSSGNYKNSPAYGPRCSRLGVPRPGGCLSGGWASGPQSQKWIQVDLGATLTIGGVATQGREHTHYNNYVTSYKLAYVDDGAFVYYSDSDNKAPKVFSGNTNPITVARNYLKRPIQAQIVRLYVVRSRGHAVFRWELFGYKTIC